MKKIIIDNKPDIFSIFKDGSLQPCFGNNIEVLSGTVIPTNLLTATLGSLYAPTVNNLFTTLSLNIDAGAQTISVVSTSGFPDNGLLSIGNEVIIYSGKNSYAFTGCSRGADGTTAASYIANTIAELRWVAAHHNALASEIIRIEGVLGQSVSGDTISVDARINTLSDGSGLLANRPASARTGAMYYDTANATWYIYNGSSWDAVTSPVIPRTLGFAIAAPVEDKVSGFTVVPSGSRDVAYIKTAAIGSSGTATISLNKLINNQLLDSYTVMALATVTIVPAEDVYYNFDGNGRSTPGGMINSARHYALYTPSIGESGTITVRGAGDRGDNWIVALDSMAYTDEYTISTSVAYATYTYSKTDTTTINLTLLSTSGAYATNGEGDKLLWALENIDGGIWGTWTLDTNWPVYDPSGDRPFPDYGYPYTVAGSNNSDRINVFLGATFTSGDSGETKVSVSERTLGSEGDETYSISFGDVLFTKVESITGSIDYITSTVEAPYYVG